MLKCGDSIGLVACSNGLSIESIDKIKELEKILNRLNLNVVYSQKIYREYSIFNGSGKEKAEELMKMYTNKNIKAIFDVSGGDLANGVLEYLNYEVIKENYKPFFGYSDLSVILNALYSKTNRENYLYQICNFIYEDKDKQIKNFKDTFINERKSLFEFNYEWIQGKRMRGIVVGGNIRCLLKLSGTEYNVDFRDKILFLEGLSGNVSKMYTYLNQYKQMKVFENVNGIILGTFTEMEREKYEPNIVELVKQICGSDIPIIKTNEIGHGDNSKCLVIGKDMSFNR